MLKFQEVTSSNLEAIAFKEDKLYVRFKGGGIYSYDSSEEEFKRFMESESKGKFFHNNIRGRSFEKPSLEEIKNLEKLQESES